MQVCVRDITLGAPGPIHSVERRAARGVCVLPPQPRVGAPRQPSRVRRDGSSNPAGYQAISAMYRLTTGHRIMFVRLAPWLHFNRPKAGHCQKCATVRIAGKNSAVPNFYDIVTPVQHELDFEERMCLTMCHVTCHSYHECVLTNNGQSCAWTGVRRTPTGKVCRPSTWTARGITRPDALVTDIVCKCEHGGVHIQLALHVCQFVLLKCQFLEHWPDLKKYKAMPRVYGDIAWIPLDQVQYLQSVFYAGSCRFCATCPTKHACNCYNTGYGGAQCQTLASCTKTPPGPGGASALLNPPPFGAVVCAAPAQNLYKYVDTQSRYNRV
jgi:hypothetical protein